MEAPFLTQWISGQLMNAICWTLIHSLWIGLLVAVLAGGVIVGTQKSSSQRRYQLLCGLLFLFAGTMGFVFYREVTSHHPSQFTSYAPATIDAKVTTAPVPVNVGAIAADSPIFSLITVFINQQVGLIFAVWLLFFALKSLKLISGLYYVHRIRHHKIHTLGDEWAHKVLIFSRTLGIQQSIRLVQSELVNVPVTVGLLKPVILLPMGLLFQLPPEQIDTILWHELAHIWRRDYAMNLLQSLVETVFFFNPGLLWLSTLIREERETCCDDIVLAHTAQKKNYLEALFAFQILSAQPAEYTMALGFGNNQVMNRLKRMVSQENKRLSIIEKIVLLSGLILLFVFAFIPNTTSAIIQRSDATQNNTTTHTANKSDVTLIRKKTPVNPIKLQRLAQTPRADVPIISATPKDTTRTFTSILFVNNNHDMVNREMMVRDDKGNQYHLKIVNNQLVDFAVNGIDIPENERAGYSELLPQIDRAMAEKSRAKQETIAEFKAKATEEHRQQLDQQMQGKQAKANRIQQQSNKSVAGSLEKQWPIGVKSEKLPSYKKPTSIQPDTLAKMQEWAKKKHHPVSDISYDKERVRGVIAILVQEKVVASASAVEWFGLSDNELIVNGNRQSDALHQKLKAAYGIKPQYGLYYGPVKMEGTGVFLDKGDLGTAYIGNPQTPSTQPKTIYPIWFIRGPSLETIVSNLMDTTLN